MLVGGDQQDDENPPQADRPGSPESLSDEASPKSLQRKAEFQSATDDEDSEEEAKIELVDGLKMVLKNPNFIKMCSSLTVLYFVITGIQFWFSDYLITVLKISKK